MISRLISLGCSLFADPTSWIYSKGNTPEFQPEQGVEYGKIGCWHTEPAICLKRVKIMKVTIKTAYIQEVSIGAKMYDLA